MNPISKTGSTETRSIETLISGWDGESVILHYDHPTGAWIVIALHSTLLGPATGGTRMKPYPNLASALEDALRLAAGMTYKFAAVGFPRGGGKAVLSIPDDLAPDARSGLLRRYGTLVRQLGGLFQAGPDVGTSPSDMDIIAETGSPYVFCRTPAAGGAGDSGPATALGVFHAIQVTCARIFGDESLVGRRILVQGAGSVGRRLIDLLHGAGADVFFSDVDPETVRDVHDRFALRSISPDRVYDTACDIFSPCALGGILNARTIPRLDCRAVVGSANNQLAEPEDAERLRKRQILYAPDFMVSLGGAVAITGIEALGWQRDEADAWVTRAIRETLTTIFTRADVEGITTLAAAERVARDRLAAHCSPSPSPKPAR